MERSETTWLRYRKLFFLMAKHRLRISPTAWGINPPYVGFHSPRRGEYSDVPIGNDTSMIL